MPFELGLAVGSRPRHTWFVFESKIRRVQKSLSDLNGTDIYIHEGTPRGVFRELCNAFARNKQQPTVQAMELIYRRLKKSLPSIMAEAGTLTPFSARVFLGLVVRASSEQQGLTKA